jgi:hypothetical protein
MRLQQTLYVVPGSYKGIRGTFDLTITLDEVYQPTACIGTSAYLAQSIVITGPGNVSLSRGGS